MGTGGGGTMGVGGGTCHCDSKTEKLSVIQKFLKRIPDSTFFSAITTAQIQKKHAREKKASDFFLLLLIVSLYLFRAAAYSTQTNAIMFRTSVSTSMVLVLAVLLVVMVVWVL
jgi:hypothetical protein